MSVALYDRAVKDKIAGWIMDPNLVVLGPDEVKRLFQQRADKSNDKPLTLPLIAISRDRDIDIQITAKRPLTYSGKVFNADDKKADHLNAVPITIKYQIDIYTRYQEEADEYIRNFVFQIINHPKLEIDIPYNNSTLGYQSYISLTNQITDNSDISERLIPGQFTRMTLRIELRDAYLFSYNHKNIPKIVATELDVAHPEVSQEPSGEVEVDLHVKEDDHYTLAFTTSKNH